MKVYPPDRLDDGRPDYFVRAWLTFTFTLIAACIVATACAHTPTYKVTSSTNFYYAELADYRRLCQGAQGLPGCREWQVALLRLWNANNDAAQANVRGGDLTAQLAAMVEAQRAEQEAKKAVHP